MSRTILKFVEYKTSSDPAGEPTWAAVCVSGEDADCGAASAELGSEQAANDWMTRHAAETGHQRFKRVYTDYAVVRPQ